MGKRLSGDKAGQIIGQVFVFLLGAFVVGGILLIGYRAIANLGEQQCRAQEVEFARKVENAFENGLTRGVVRTHTFTLPCGATELCLVERDAIDAKTLDSPGETESSDYPLIENSLVSEEGGSVWVRDENGYRRIDGITRNLPVGTLTVTPPNPDVSVQCYPGDSVTLVFEGKGQRIDIKEAN